MNYAAIKKCDIANGPGVRVSLFVSGCRHHCKNCFNEETWNFSYGNPINGQVITEILSELHRPYVDGLSILGGEPMEPENQASVNYICWQIKTAYPQKEIWLWTGCVFNDDLTLNGNYNTEYVKKILQSVDYIVDGPFVEDLKDIRLKFRGSSNQRIIDVKKSVESNKIVLYNI